MGTGCYCLTISRSCPQLPRISLKGQLKFFKHARHEIDREAQSGFVALRMTMSVRSIYDDYVELPAMYVPVRLVVTFSI